MENYLGRWEESTEGKQPDKPATSRRRQMGNRSRDRLKAKRKEENESRKVALH